MASSAATTAAPVWTDGFMARDSVKSILLSDNDYIITANHNMAYQHPPSSNIGMSINLGEPVRYPPYLTNLRQQQYSSFPADHAGANVVPPNQYGWRSSSSSSSFQGRSQYPHPWEKSHFTLNDYLSGTNNGSDMTNDYMNHMAMSLEPTVCLFLSYSNVFFFSTSS